MQKRIASRQDLYANLSEAEAHGTFIATSQAPAKSLPSVMAVLTADVSNFCSVGVFHTRVAYRNLRAAPAVFVVNLMYPAIVAGHSLSDHIKSEPAQEPSIPEP